MTQTTENPNSANSANSAPNVDGEEIEKFDRIAAKWWDPEGEFKPLHQINPLRLDFIQRHAPLPGKRALDVGCGGGILTEALAQQGAAALGIDASAKVIEVAKLHALESGISSETDPQEPQQGKVAYRNCTVEQLAAEQPASYDIVCCLELLEHVPQPEKMVAACATLAKPGGAIFFSTINRNPKSFLLAIVAAEYVLNLLPRGTHQFDKLIRPSELTHWCETANLSIAEMTGLHYNPLAQTYWLAPGVDVNYILCARRPPANK